MPGIKTNEREGTRAVHKSARMSASKVRVVLDLIRNKPVREAADILRLTEREAAAAVLKVLMSAIANAEANDGLDGDELFVSACFADEGKTIGRFKPRARGRASRIRKRTCHITVIVSRLPEEQLNRLRSRQHADLEARRRRTRGSAKATTPAKAGATTETPADEAVDTASASEVEGVTTGADTPEQELAGDTADAGAETATDDDGDTADAGAETTDADTTATIDEGDTGGTDAGESGSAEEKSE